MERIKKHYIIPIFVPHYGCPHDCIFCNQKKITNVSTNTTADDVKAEIEKYLGYFNRDAFIEVAFYGGSFTAIDMDIQSELLEVPYKYKQDGIIDSIRVSTRPDAIDNEILDNLKKYGVGTIELGVQSLNDDVLMASERGHTSKDVYIASSLIKEKGIRLGLQMMIGLPGDSRESIIFTAKEFINLKPDCVRIYPTLVIKDTNLEKLLKNGRYKSMKLDEAIDISTVILILFKLNNINIIRVGLQVTDNIQMGKDVIDGPFHPAFRQLVESNIFRVLLDYYFNQKNIDIMGKILMIGANEKNISNISGQKSVNKKYLINRYSLKKIKIYEEDLGMDEINISIEDFYDKIDIKRLMKFYLNKNINL